MKAVKCPVCDGSGKYNEEKCHGCDGKGWVEVREDCSFSPYPWYYHWDSPTIPDYPYVTWS